MIAILRILQCHFFLVHQNEFFGSLKQIEENIKINNIYCIVTIFLESK